MEIIPERVWGSLLREVLAARGVTMLIGATDSGKSTLAKFLLRGVIDRGIKASILDSDVGQSSLGPPGTITMRVFDGAGEADGETSKFDKMFFVGTVNPARRLPLVLCGTERLTAVCRKKADITLIDTCGLVGGEAGKALKVRKIRSVKPDRVVALQRGSELEHILDEMGAIAYWRVKVSSAARVRSRQERMRYRRERLATYFENTVQNKYVFNVRGLSFFDGTLPVFPGEGVFGSGTIIGLNRREYTLALGVLDEIDSGQVSFRSPVRRLEKIDSIIFGDETLQ